MGPLGLFLFFAVIAVIVASPGGAAESQTVVRLGYTNAQGAKVAVFLGADEGVFARHGVDLRLTRVSPGTAGVPKLVAREIDLFLGNSGPVVEAIATGSADLAVIASLGVERFAIFTRPAIAKVEELKGKTFGVTTPGASQDRIAARALKKLGLDPGGDVRVVATGLSSSVERLRALARGEVDAVNATADDLSQLSSDERGRIRKLVDLADLGILVSGADVSATRGYLRAEAETARRFLRALGESLALAKARPDFVAATYKKYLGVGGPEALDTKVKEYYAGNPPDRPLPNKKAIASHLEEVKEKFPGLELREAAAYVDESLQ